jgi:hypothetical protein
MLVKKKKKKKGTWARETRLEPQSLLLLLPVLPVLLLVLCCGGQWSLSMVVMSLMTHHSGRVEMDQRRRRHGHTYLWSSDSRSVLLFWDNQNQYRGSRPNFFGFYLPL